MADQSKNNPAKRENQAVDPKAKLRRWHECHKCGGLIETLADLLPTMNGAKGRRLMQYEHKNGCPSKGTAHRAVVLAVPGTATPVVKAPVVKG
jgi:hypothetical protein